MPVYTISYNSINNYDAGMREAVLEFLIFPAENLNQKLLTYEIVSKPDAASFFSSNLYHFDTLRYRLKANTVRFELEFSATVEKQTINPFARPWLSSDEEMEIVASRDFLIENIDFLEKTPLTSLPENFEFPLKKNESVFEFAQKCNELVHEMLEYDLKSAAVENQLIEVLALQKGVCQDYAHLMITVLRANKIPARYVSGYLNQGTDYAGSGAIHAWVEVLIPGVGWIGFDPTNNLLEDHHYIKIAHGVDYLDCQSLKGVVKSGGSNTTDYQVIVNEMNNYTDQ